MSSPGDEPANMPPPGAAPGGPAPPPGAVPPPQSGPPPPAAAGAPNPQEQAAASKRLQQTQAQVNEVVDIMRVNVDKVLERDAKLSELDERADNLQHGASQFEANAGKLKRKFWWKNCKSMIMMGVVIGLVVIVACVWIANKMGYLGGSKTPAGQQVAPAPAAPVAPAQQPQVPVDSNSAPNPGT